MKKIIPFSLVMLIVLTLSMTSCTKHATRAVVLKDCTGTYLRIHNKDYNVCNFELIQSYPEGTELNVFFQKIDECNPLGDPIICEMYHKTEGIIEITKIK